MRASAAVGIDNDLSSREAGVPFRAADLEAPCWVDEIFGVFVEKPDRNDGFDDGFLHVGGNALLQDFGIVLGGENDRVHADGRFAVVFHGDLRFAVRAKIAEGAVLPKLREFFGKFMGEHDGKRHQLLRFAAGVAEHHALIAGAETVGGLPSRLVLERGIDAEGDVGRLAVDKFDDAALVKSEVARRIADLADDSARHGRIIDLCAARHFARDEERVVGSAAFNGCARLLIAPDELIQNGVCNAVADFVGMSFRYAFA